MRVGGVLQQTLGLYQRFFWRFAAITAIVMAVLELPAALGTTADSDGAAVLWTMVGVAITLIGTFLVQGALTLAVDDVRDGRVDSSIGELFARARPHLGAMILASLLSGIAIVIGLVLFIAPGLYLLTLWALIIPAIVLENRSAGDSFSRSSDLTAGHRWAVLGLALVTLLVSLVIGGLVIGIFSFVLPEFLGAWLGSLIADCVTIPFIALAWTVAYFELLRTYESTPASA